MKLNNKGFAITIVLYGTLVLFLLLIVSLLGILSTYKLRLEKLYPEPPVVEEEKKLTCSLKATYENKITTIKINVNDTSLLHSTPYSYSGTWTKRNPLEKNGRPEYKQILVRDKNGNQVNCGRVYFTSTSTTKYKYTGNSLKCCEKGNTSVCSNVMLGDSGYFYNSSTLAINACKAGCTSGLIYVSGCGSESTTFVNYSIHVEKPK